MNGFIINTIPEKMYGFIKGEDGRQYFFHASEVVVPYISSNLDFAHYLKHGIRVEFDKAESGKGPRATNVIVEGMEVDAETNEQQDN